jgi:hypothetical protein
VEIDGDFNMPPVIDVVRYLTEWVEEGFKFSYKSKEEITRIGIRGKAISIFRNGEKVVGFTMNNPNDLFDSIEYLSNNPLALIKLQKDATTRFLEKSLPLPTESVRPAAATQQSPASSKPKQGAG